MPAKEAWFDLDQISALFKHALVVTLEPEEHADVQAVDERKRVKLQGATRFGHRFRLAVCRRQQATIQKMRIRIVRIQ